MGVAAAPTAWLPLQETAAEFRGECAALEQFVDKLLGDLDDLRLELEHKADELDQAQRQLIERSQQLDEQRNLSAQLTEHLEKQAKQLDLTLGEIRDLRQQLDSREEQASRQQASERQSEDQQALELRIVQLEAERDELRRHVNMASSAAGAEARPSWLGELDDLRVQLSEAQNELSGALHRAVESNNLAATLLPGELPEMSPEWRLERCELEHELELVRGRAAELQDTVDAQRRELAESRAELSAELKQLRRLVEQQASPGSNPSQTLVKQPAQVAAATEEPVDGAASEEDPVMHSVMAQFAKLQKDMAQRRKKK